MTYQDYENCGIVRDFSRNKKLVFNKKFGFLGDLLNVEVELELLREATKFWDPSYQCFSFGYVDLAHTFEEYYKMIGIFPKVPS